MADGRVTRGGCLEERDGTYLNNEYHFRDVAKLNSNNEHCQITCIVDQHQDGVLGWKVNTYKAETRSARTQESTNEAWSRVV